MNKRSEVRDKKGRNQGRVIYWASKNFLSGGMITVTRVCRGRWMDESMRDVRVKPSRTLWGSWARKPFRVSRSLFAGNRLQPPRPSLKPSGQIQTVAKQGREEMQRQGRRSQETTVQPWGRVLVPPQGIHITISLSCL